MAEKIRFTKMHGCGNDYIYVNTMECSIADPARAAILLSDRHRGVGSDGLVLIGQCVGLGNFSMRIFNADGSEAMMCGNASRCVGKYLYERGITTQTRIRLHTKAGVKTLSLHVRDGVVESVTVDMGEPQFENEEQFVPSRGLPEGTFVSMGNPHYVVFTDQVDKVGETGRVLEHHPAFPQRCNIEFVAPLISPRMGGSIGAAFPHPVHCRDLREAPEHQRSARKRQSRAGGGQEGAFRVRVWERGSGITQACGTGACATAVAAALTGRAGRASQVVMDGGALSIEWRESDNHVLMTGPAEFVFDGEVELTTLNVEH